MNFLDTHHSATGLQASPTPLHADRGTSRWPWRSILLAIIPFALLAGSLGDWLILTPDTFAYLQAARGIHETGHLPDARLIAPPLFPLILAPLISLGDLPALAGRILLTLGWAASGVLAYQLYRRELGRWPAWIVGLFVATHSAMLFQSATLLSELVYMPLSLGALVVFSRWRDDRRVAAASLLVGSLLAIATIMTRSMGIMLLPVGALVLLMQSSPSWRGRLLRTGVFTSLALVVVFAWNHRENRYPVDSSYGSFLAKARSVEQTDATGLQLQVERLAHFGGQRLREITAVVLPRRVCWGLLASPWGSWIQWAAGGIVVGLLCLRVLRKRTPAEAYALLLLGLLAIWPFDEGVRFVLPLVPIFAGSLMWAMLEAWRWAKRRRVTHAGAIACACAIALGFAVELTVARGRFDDARRKSVARLAEVRSLADRFRRYSPPDAAMLCVTPDGDASKTRLTGAAYMARVQVDRYLDVYDTDLSDLPSLQGTCAWVHNTLAAQAEVIWGRRPQFEVGHFAVFMPESPHAGTPLARKPATPTFRQ